MTDENNKSKGSLSAGLEKPENKKEVKEEKPEKKKEGKKKKPEKKKEEKKKKKKDEWAGKSSGEKADIIIEIIRKNLLKPFLVLIAIIIIITAAKYIRGLYNKYPRAFTLTNFLDISSKYDKSTGLDIELAETLAKSLSDYISMPSTILQNINYKSKFLLKTNSFINADENLNIKNSMNKCNLSKNININDYHDTGIEPKYMNYIRKNLFNNFNIDANNKLYQTLRKFIENGEAIFNRKNIDINNSKFKDGDKFKGEYDNKFFKEYFSKIKGLNNSNINEYLTDYYKSISYTNPDYTFVNVKLTTKPIENFYNELNKIQNKDLNQQIDIDSSSIETLFSNILKTKSINTNYNENVTEIFKNIFLRNVLYYIINKHSSIISDHLEKLENNNIISYINPTIYTKSSDSGVDLFKKYGKYLYLEDNTKNLKPFKEIIDNSKASIPSNISNTYQNPISITSPQDIDNDIKQLIMTKIRELNTTGDYGGISYLKYINQPKVFEILKKYKREKNDKFNYQDDYNNYKIAIERVKLQDEKGKGYDSGNAILNKIHKNSGKSSMEKRFNINKAHKTDKCILEIYNILSMFEILKDKIENTNEITYDIYIDYLYYFEKYTTLQYYDTSDGKYRFLFNNEDKLLFRNYFIEIQEDLLYIRDKDIINTSLFTTLLFYSPGFDKETIENLLTISRFYMSFTELKLADNFINDIQSYKENRTGYNLFNDYILPNIKYLLYDIIIKKYLWEEWDIVKMKGSAKEFGKIFISKLTDECIWFSTPIEKEIMSQAGIHCKEGLVVEHMFGFLKGLTKIPTMLSKIPDMALGIIKLSLKLLQFIGVLIIMFGYIGKLGLIGLITLFLKVLFYLCVIFIKKILYIPFLFAWVTPLILLILSMKTGAPRWVLKGSNMIATFINLSIWLMSILLLDLTFIEVLGVFVTSIILLMFTLFKSLFILIIVLFLFIIGIVILPFDTMCDNALSRFLYRNIISCENSPFSWYKNSRYDLENKCSRGFFCNLNCGTNYRLSDSGLYCEKAPTNVPYYCPQPLLYKNYKDEKINGKNHILSFFINNYPKVLASDPDKQSEFIMNYQKNKSEYYQTCNTFSNGDGAANKKGYNVIGKSVCASAYNIKDQNIKNKIKDVCRQTYCSNGKYENFCYKYDEIKNKTKYLGFLENENKFIENLKKILFVVILVSLIIYFISLIEKVKKNKPLFNKQQFYDIIGDTRGNFRERYQNFKSRNFRTRIGQRQPLI